MVAITYFIVALLHFLCCFLYLLKGKIMLSWIYGLLGIAWVGLGIYVNKEE